MNELLQDIKHVLRTAGRWTGGERRIHLEIAGDMMRQYQALLEVDMGLVTYRCGYCGRYECSH